MQIDFRFIALIRV